MKIFGKGNIMLNKEEVLDRHKLIRVYIMMLKTYATNYSRIQIAELEKYVKAIIKSHNEALDEIKILKHRL